MKKKQEGRTVISGFFGTVGKYMRFKWYILTQILTFILDFFKSNNDEILKYLTWAQSTCVSRCDICEPNRLQEITLDFDLVYG